MKTHYQLPQTGPSAPLLCGANHFKNGITTTNINEVTCKKCLNLMKKEGLI